MSRVRSSADERRVEVFLTGAGRKLFKKAFDVPHQLGCVTGVSHATAKMLIKEVNTSKKYLGDNGSN